MPVRGYTTEAEVVEVSLESPIKAMSTFPSNVTFGAQPAWDVALLFPYQGEWSVGDYLSLTDGTNQLVEFTDGKVEVLTMPTTAHQRILIFLFKCLSRFVEDRELGEVMIAALRVRLALHKFREPDIVFVRRENRSYIQERFWTGADLVVEIVSEDAESRERDYVTKRVEYAAAGIPEYWIVDPAEKRISVLTLVGSEYVSSGEFKSGEQAVSKLLAGFAVDVAETFRSAEDRS
jgi:Uma2 family endonuclease